MNFAKFLRTPFLQNTLQNFFTLLFTLLTFYLTLLYFTLLYFTLLYFTLPYLLFTLPYFLPYLLFTLLFTLPYFYRTPYFFTEHLLQNLFYRLLLESFPKKYKSWVHFCASSLFQLDTKL